MKMRWTSQKNEGGKQQRPGENKQDVTHQLPLLYVFLICYQLSILYQISSHMQTIGLTLTNPLNTWTPHHAILRKLLHSRLQLCLMQIEIINSQNGHTRKRRSSTINKKFHKYYKKFVMVLSFLSSLKSTVLFWPQILRFSRPRRCLR